MKHLKVKTCIGLIALGVLFGSMLGMVVVDKHLKNVFNKVSVYMVDRASRGPNYTRSTLLDSVREYETAILMRYHPGTITDLRYQLMTELVAEDYMTPDSLNER